MATKSLPVVYDASDAAPDQGGEMALGGAIEGAERLKRETVNWTPTRVSPDKAINSVRPEADARSRDMMMNDGHTQGVIRLQKDSIIGGSFRTATAIAAA